MTRRTPILLFLSLLLYLFANQTQVGWLYVMSALLAGVVVVAYFMNRRVLGGVTASRGIKKVISTKRTERQIQGQADDDFYEGNSVHISLRFKNKSKIPAAQIRAIELCPITAPEFGSMDLFIPVLPAQDEAEIGYEIEIYKRGIYEYPPISLKSSSPFGFFTKKKSLSVPTNLLVYPELRPLKRLELLDRQPAQQMTRPKAGVGVEVIGTRPYRPGDSPRHIHWRSVARTGQLISKEFVDESQPGLTLALDLFPYESLDIIGKHTPFEWMVKLAASIGDYAIRRGYPLHLLTDEGAWPAPHGPLTRRALFEFLARVHPGGATKLSDLLAYRPTQTFVTALLASPDPEVVAALLNLKHQGQEVLAVLLDPFSFPDSGASAAPLAASLIANGIETRLISFGEDWNLQLSDKKDQVFKF